MMRLLVLGCLLGCFALHPLGLAQASTPEDFEKVCDLMEGRWVGDVTWVADWPGLGKRGGKSVAFLDCSRTDDGKGLMIRFFGGTGSATSLVAYDAVNKKIRQMLVVSGGYVGDQEITVDNNRITIKGTGSLPDGGKNTFTVTRTFSEGGTKFVDSGSGDIDGVATDQALQTWRKVSGKYEPEAAATELAEFGKRLQGRWVRDIVYIHDWKGAPGGKGAKATGYHEFIWINDGHALREVSYDGESRAESIMCWDPVSKGIFTLGTTATGDSFLGQWKKTAERQWTLTPIGGGIAEGKKFGGELTYTFSEDGSRIDCSGVITLDGEPLNELEDVLHRVSP